MSQEKKHSPLPWRISTSQLEIRDAYSKWIVDIDTGNVVADAENGAFIVRAVNSHAALVEALSNWLDWVGERLDSLDPGDPIRTAIINTHGKRIGITRAALALAGEKEAK